MAEELTIEQAVVYRNGVAVPFNMMSEQTGTGEVYSVFGRKGAVTAQAGDYTADMVGARPDTWNPVKKTVITPHGGSTVADMTASEIIDASRNGTVEAEYTDPTTNELRTYQYFKQMPDGRAVFAVNGYIEDGVPKQTLIYVDYAGNVTTETRDADMVKGTEKGQAGGVASLDSSGKVPASQLPEMDYIPTSQKGAASGVATLNGSKKVPAAQIPALNYAPKYKVSTTDLQDGVSALATGTLYFVYE